MFVRVIETLSVSESSSVEIAYPLETPCKHELLIEDIRGDDQVPQYYLNPTLIHTIIIILKLVKPFSVVVCFDHINDFVFYHHSCSKFPTVLNKGLVHASSITLLL